VAWVVAHSAREASFPSWDQRVYYGLSTDLYDNFRISAWRGLENLISTFRSTHNALFALPMVLGYALLGPSWRTYQILVAVLYALPAGLALGKVGSELAARRRGTVFLSVSVFALTLPALWQSVLAYYPDVCALAALGGQVWFAWRGRERLDLKSLIGMAGCAALAVLLRRHFAFPALSVYAATGVMHCLVPSARGGLQDVARRLVRAFLRLGASALLGLGAMFAIAPLYARQFFLNYDALYEAWRRPSREMVLQFATDTGLGLTLLAVLGLWFARRRGLLQRGAAPFLGSVVLVWCVVWWSKSGETGLQYDLHVFPLVQAVGMGLGVTALVDTHRAPGQIAAGILVLGSVVRFLLAPWEPWLPPSQALWMAPNLAPDRMMARDVEAYRSLVEALRAITPPENSIYVAASSIWLNEAILRSVDERYPSPDGVRLKLLDAVHVDTRDALPISGLVAAQVVVAATPEQYHLRPENQRVVGGVVRTMRGGRPYTRAFQLVRSVTFGAGFRADVYLRVRPTSLQEALQVADDILAEMGWSLPGDQSQWIIASPTAGQWAGMISPSHSWVRYFHYGRDPVHMIWWKLVDGHPRISARLRLSNCRAGRAHAECVGGPSRGGAESESHPIASTKPGTYTTLDLDLGEVRDCRPSLVIGPAEADDEGCDLDFPELGLVGIEKAGP